MTNHVKLGGAHPEQARLSPACPELFRRHAALVGMGVLQSLKDGHDFREAHLMPQLSCCSSRL